MNNHLLTKIKKYLVNHEKRVKYYKYTEFLIIRKFRFNRRLEVVI